MRALSPKTDLTNLTPARVALDRTGVSLTTRTSLDFSLAQARARDAVHAQLAVGSLLHSLQTLKLQAIPVHSAARSRAEYLSRPDLGRTLSAHSAATLPPLAKAGSLCLVLADGLSALAIERHALPTLHALLPRLAGVELHVVVAEQARVALGDHIGELLHADATVVLLGERPGLSSPDSLGAYITWKPRRGRTDAERNCVSNIRIEGLAYQAAAEKILWYLNEGRRLAGNGVGLREQDSASLTGQLPSPSSALPR